MPWLEDVQSCVESMPQEFRLSDLDRFLPRLHRRHPSNRHVREEVRQQLELLQEKGEIELVVPGLYRRLMPAAEWPLQPGDTTTRQELAEILQMEGQAALGRGMFKRASGPFTSDLLLFHHRGANPYGDRFDSDQRIVYVGQGQEGDQTLDGYNGILARHLEEGHRVHLFVKEGRGGAEIRYEGQVALEEYRRIYRSDEGRSVIEFFLRPIREGDLNAFGHAYHDVLQESLEPHTKERPRTVRVLEQMLRDRAFAAHLRRYYNDQCAVCGPPLVHEQHVDVQGAHVQAVAAGGPDAINNGLCLCARHHWAFDHGIFSLSDDHRVQLRMPDPHKELQAGALVTLPEDLSLAPHPEYLKWHRRTWRFV